MATEPPALRVLADFASLAVRLKLLEPRAVVRWADELIASSHVPPPWMMDLALIDHSDPHAVIVALRAVPGTADPRESVALFNALVLREWRRGRLDIAAVRRIGWRLYQIYRDTFGNDDPTKWGIVVECEGESLDDGIISEVHMREQIDQDLSAFAADLPRLPPWE